jgi:hypothetical protein
MARVSAASGGQPSDGSRVTFAVDQVTPSAALAFFSPTSADLAADHTASSTLTVDSTVTAVKVRVSAIPPGANATPAETVLSVVRP